MNKMFITTSRLTFFLLVSISINSIVSEGQIENLANSLMNFSSSSQNLGKVFESPTKLFESPAKLFENSAKFLENPANLLNPMKMFEAPTKGISNVIKESANLTASGMKKIGKATDNIEKVADNTQKVATGLGTVSALISGPPVVEPESVYFDHLPHHIEEPEDYEIRKPKYFSRDCEFKMACEIGRALKPLTLPKFKELVRTNKIVHNLQNRYTRAMTYGMLYNKCDKYYCLLLQFFGGPKQFASGVVELMNRIANPDMY